MTTKPPPLHERGDVFEEIASQHVDNGGRHPDVAEAKFRGALMMIQGTAIPKGHGRLARAIAKSALQLGLGSNPLVDQALKWIEFEKTRHEVSD